MDRQKIHFHRPCLCLYWPSLYVTSEHPQGWISFLPVHPCLQGNCFVTIAQHPVRKEEVNYYYDELCKINLYCLKLRHDDWWKGLGVHWRDCTIIASYLQRALLTPNDDTDKILQSVRKKYLICFLVTDAQLLKTDEKHKCVMKN